MIQTDKMNELLCLVERHAVNDGMQPTTIPNLHIIKGSQTHEHTPLVYPPGIAIGVQGKKYAYLDGKRYSQSAGDFLTSLIPIPVSCELVEASLEKPYLALGIPIDLDKITNMILKLDRFEDAHNKPDIRNASGIFSAPIQENLLDAAVRLLRMLDSPRETAVLSEAVIDEIYYRIFFDQQSGDLIHFLRQRGQIHQIAKAVEHVHQYLDQPVSIDELASLVNMSSSGFHKKFKDVMHISPLQYAKMIKLDRAKIFIQDGRSVTEASHMVGYSNLAQFSREYKRQFGYLPSATAV